MRKPRFLRELELQPGFRQPGLWRSQRWEATVPCLCMWGWRFNDMCGCRRASVVRGWCDAAAHVCLAPGCLSCLNCNPARHANATGEAGQLVGARSGAVASGCCTKPVFAQSRHAPLSRIACQTWKRSRARLYCTTHLSTALAGVGREEDCKPRLRPMPHPPCQSVGPSILKSGPVTPSAVRGVLDIA
ncbi:hypothetical protein BJ546DRAFT_24837 [Cryomyces antarcticus]